MVTCPECMNRCNRVVEMTEYLTHFVCRVCGKEILKELK